MAPRPEESSSGFGRTSGPPALTLLGAIALSAGRIAKGVPIDGVSLALHLIAGLAALRLVPFFVGRDVATSGTTGVPSLSAPKALTDEAAAPQQRYSPAEVFDRYLAAPAEYPEAHPLRAGSSWLRGGPYAGVVFALVLGVHALLVPLLRTPLTLALLPAACAPFALWWWRGHATRRARGGVAVLLTPTQLIVRDDHGARSAVWTEVQAVSIESRPTWDVLRGARHARMLTISRQGTAPLLVTEDELGVTVQGALAMVQAYRSAVVAAGAACAGDPVSPAS